MKFTYHHQIYTSGDLTRTVKFQKQPLAGLLGDQHNKATYFGRVIPLNTIFFFFVTEFYSFYSNSSYSFRQCNTSSQGPYLRNIPWTKCGYLSLNHAERHPGQDPPKEIHFVALLRLNFFAIDCRNAARSARACSLLRYLRLLSLRSLCGSS